ncbi:MAG: hypothetical protein IT494_00060 [Gammaproteobacteria bacterium]|nr:hypothetical protein [Gammaproteobacteria bacterium]
MPLLRDLSLAIAVEDIACGRHTARARPLSPAVRTRLAELIETVTAQRWLQPAIAYRIRTITDRGGDWIELDGAIKLQAPLLAHRMRPASHLATVVCTVGESLSRQVSAWFGSGNPARAVLLDELGSIALTKLADRCGELLRDEALALGLDLSGSLHPGDDGFAIEQQAAVLQLAGGDELGIALQGGSTLAPLKSLTAVYGLGKKMPNWSAGDNCATCRARERCSYRRDGRTAGIAA